MNDKTIDIPELSAKIFNLLNFLEENCIRLIEINSKLIHQNPENQTAINKNINTIEAVFNKVIAVRDELEENIKEQLINIHNKEFADKNGVKILKSLNAIEVLTGDILNETFYVNPNGRIIK